MVNIPQDAAKNLGADIKALRTLRRQSLLAVAVPAKISATYLQKIERGAVQNPSPRVLMRLAEVLNCEYNHLMDLAGYLQAPKYQPSGKASLLDAALRNQDLTTEEQHAVMAFIHFLKAQRRVP